MKLSNCKNCTRTKNSKTNNFVQERNLEKLCELCFNQNNKIPFKKSQKSLENILSPEKISNIPKNPFISRNKSENNRYIKTSLLKTCHQHDEYKDLYCSNENASLLDSHL